MVESRLLEVENLELSYGQVQALRGVSFGVEAGQIVAIVGANGAGKTSLLGAISGLVRPRRGHIIHNGHDITGWPAHRIVGRGIVQVPEGRAILGGMSVQENLELGAFCGRTEGQIEAMLHRFGSIELADPDPPRRDSFNYREFDSLNVVFDHPASPPS